MDIIKIKQKYAELCKTPSDINEHLPDLYNIALQCDHITEMGVRSCVSTWAFLLAKPIRLISYDINYHENFEEVLRARPDWRIFVADVLKVKIEKTDLLFIDTLHTYTQLKKELKLHAGNVRKYIIFHDTTTYGHTPEPSSWQTENIMENYIQNDKGIMPAIEEFLEDNEDWRIFRKKENNNGLLILKNINYE